MTRDPCGTDVATQPHGSASWAGTDPCDAYLARRAKWAKRVWPTGIVGQEYHVEREWGCHRPIGRCKVTKEPSILKLLNRQSFLYVGLILYL